MFEGNEEAKKEQVINEILKQRIPRVVCAEDARKVLTMFGEVCKVLYDEQPDSLSHLYRYVIAALLSLGMYHSGKITPKVLDSLLMASFAVGRMREANPEVLESIKSLCIESFGTITREDIEEEMNDEVASISELDSTLRQAESIIKRFKSPNEHNS